MGRGTFDSLKRKALPNRLNIVISSQPKEALSDDPSLLVAKSFDEALASALDLDRAV